MTAATVFAAMLPPVHIHLASHDDHDHDHATAIEHAHWSLHGASRAAFDDDDGRAIYVDRPAIACHGDTAVERPLQAVIALLTIPGPATFTAVERQRSGNSPRDGPAHALLPLRAPPLAL